MKKDEFQKEVENIIFENFEVDNWYDVPSPVHDMDVGGATDYEYFNGEGACCQLFGSPRSWEERAEICADLWLDHRGCLFERELKH
jgi:hypothetical protein